MTMEPTITGDRVRLESHPTARNRAVATADIVEGTIIVIIPSLSSVLLPSQKGLRCDYCFRKSDGERTLRKCTGCGSYWYCSTECQAKQWKEHHKKLCKTYLLFTSSNSYQALQNHEKLDALLLAHLLAQWLIPDSSVPQDESLPLSIFCSLLPGPDTRDVYSLPLPSLKPSISQERAKYLYSRFSNNNFVIHSHLTTIGHGIFPLASRLFNHSCHPNAAARFQLTPMGVTMEVVALQKIVQDEEICIPYLDPAMLQTRQKVFELTYGFKCTCPSCVELEGLGVIPPPPVKPDELSTVATSLRSFVGLDKQFLVLPERPTEPISPLLHCVFNEAYLSNLSENFSESSHESRYEQALEAGVTLLGAYILIYPPNYPQIGMHLLEMAKTAWNMLVSSEATNPSLTKASEERARAFLAMSHKVLRIFGKEGDVDGPLSEVATLQSLLDS
ncbi:hypothetical protein H0H92_006537 [Tricholoma furcatifolium]|nr:hypothetical protein H0H92_006537 [Tricholoma furcatifolium]